MAEPELVVNKTLLQRCLNWFQGHFRHSVVSLIEGQFSNYPLPNEIKSVLDRWQEIREHVDAAPTEAVDVRQLFDSQLAVKPENRTLFKQIFLTYRRHWAAHTEALRDKTIHLELAESLETDINMLDAVTEQHWFHAIEPFRLPRSGDYLPVQFVEQSDYQQMELLPRQYDEKFHVLQSPSLFLPDLAYFRAKCEMRGTPVAVAFLDIDNFKAFNTAYTETKIDRNLLPRFMQTIEGHVYHHGYAYRQGGDEYLVLLPSLSQRMAVAMLDELREQLATLSYPEIAERTTVSIGLCIAEPDCPLTDRELKARANEAKDFAKENGKNCIATYYDPRFVKEELKVVAGDKTEKGNKSKTKGSKSKTPK